MFSTTQGIVLVVLVLIALVLLAVVTTEQSRRRRERLRQRFGPEYDHAVEQFGGVSKAERELSERARRLERIQIRDLNDVDRARFANAWSAVQVKFVDNPPDYMDRVVAINLGGTLHLTQALLPAMIVGYLSGNPNPVISSADADFSQLGILFRGVFDVGMAPAEYLAGCWSKGAA